MWLTAGEAIDYLIISIASGKGRTGKTTLATNLAMVLAKKGYDVTYVDADVEEPNGHIFLKPKIEKKSEVTVPIPKVDDDECTLCGECSEICQENAIAILGDRVKVFPSLCNSCGGCFAVCPVNAIEEIPKNIGWISMGKGRGVNFFEGRLLIEESETTPIIRELRKASINAGITIIDASPGTSCTVIKAINNTDYVILVTEPTPFGLNDLKLAVDMVSEIGLPYGVVINRFDIGDNRVEKYCFDNNVDILLKIPFDRKIAEVYSRGEMIFGVDVKYNDILYNLYQKITNKVNNDRVGSY